MTGKGVGVGAGAGVDTRGKHRVLAELKRMEQETRCLEGIGYGLLARVVTFEKNMTAILLHELTVEDEGRSLGLKCFKCSDYEVQGFGSGVLLDDHEITDKEDDAEARSVNPLLASLCSFVRRKELADLDNLERASAACEEVLNHVQTKPDPLLPETNGPLHPSWDRWFEGLQEVKGCRCWIL
ncbi:Guanine nucleotide-binding protein subunit gamma 1-like protein [Drosera capensis]